VLSLHAVAPLAFGPSWMDPNHLLGQGGLALACLIIFAECGLLVGFFLPGDTLLFSVGVLTGAGTISEPLWLACLLLSLAAFAGNVVGYEIGRAAGPKIFTKPDSTLFSREHVDRAQGFFDKYGALAIILARFVPIVRTFITVVAGVAKLDRRYFLTYSAIGGLLWASGMTVLGHLLGGIDFIAENVEKLVLLAVALTVIPIILETLRNRWKRRRSGPAAAPATPVAESREVRDVIGDAVDDQR
jgi:membrane-associated protein